MNLAAVHRDFYTQVFKKLDKQYHSPYHLTAYVGSHLDKATELKKGWKYVASHFYQFSMILHEIYVKVDDNAITYLSVVFSEVDPEHLYYGMSYTIPSSDENDVVTFFEKVQMTELLESRPYALPFVVGLKWGEYNAPTRFPAGKALIPDTARETEAELKGE